MKKSATRYVCIHGHFYQPPRENPWLEMVEIQDSAAPYHDWNDRITAECYAVNGASRILNGKKQIVRILNNYARISFNFGPTLLSWLEENAPRTYRMIQDADHLSRERFGGHGSAMAQVYNHVIMPLASREDKETQIRWGIADFVKRFQRKPEGMWLAETAADSETLEMLADHGILFTVLAPAQCAAVRPLLAKGAEEEVWTLTPDATVDTTRPYVVRFASGKSLAVFFYDGPRSRAIAFEGLLNSGETFASRLISGFREKSDGPQLVHVATDGESYGHHHRHGEMALSYALKWIEEKKLAKLTNYGEFLTIAPPVFEAQIYENTSWSCMHGVERWRADCGCNGGRAGWNQKWRAPLRAALNELRDVLIEPTQKLGTTLFADVWKARDAYIDVILDRSRASTERFFAAHGRPGLSESDRVTALKLMEIQRQAQLMYTSCGWFFDDISGIETVQIISYASRAIQLAEEIFHAAGLVSVGELERSFIESLREAKSNDPAEGDGSDIYVRRVKTAQVGLEQVGAHYAISSVFGTYPEDSRLFCYTVHREAYDVFTSGRGRLATGRARVASKITNEAQDISFAVLHFGDQNITAGVKDYAAKDAEQFAELVAGVEKAALRADLPQVVRLFDGYFGSAAYSLTSLFTDEQRRILRLILNSTLWEVENSLCTIYEAHASLLHFLSQSGLPKPPALTLAAGFAINAGLRRVLESDPIDAIQIRSLLGLAGADQVVLDTRLLSYLADQRMKRVMIDLHAKPTDREALDKALLIARAIRLMPFELNLWQAQNIWYDTMNVARTEVADLPSIDQAGWDEAFHELGGLLYISVEDLVVEEKIPVNAASE
jgi:alpha-amylase/alpha-mannosidase (GH57 family)